MPHIYFRQDTLVRLFPDGLPVHWLQMISDPLIGSARLGFPVDLDNLNPFELRDLLAHLKSVHPDYTGTENLESKGIAFDLSQIDSCEYLEKELLEIKQVWTDLTPDQQVRLFPLICGGLNEIIANLIK